MPADDLRTIGVVVAAHGLQGALKVDSLTDFPERFQSLTRVFLRRGDDVLGEAHVKRVRYASAHVHLSLREVTNRNAAQELVGVEICVPDSESWTLPQDVYYVTDLIGYAAVGDDGTPIGALRNILNGPQSILEIEHGGAELLVPFVAEWVGEIDRTERTIIILNWRRLLSPESAE